MLERHLETSMTEKFALESLEDTQTIESIEKDFAHLISYFVDIKKKSKETFGQYIQIEEKEIY